MSDSQIRTLSDGQFEIVHLRPTVVGVMIDRAMAEAFVRFLGGRDGETITLEREVGIIPTSFAGSAAPAEAVEAPVPAMPPRAVPARVAMPDARPVSEADRDAAFACLRAGEKLTDVAERYGMSMGRLRGLWAQASKTGGPAAEPAQAEDGEDCRLCGKTFVATGISDGLCARCSR